MTEYKPIESYGVIGDLRTVALVGKDGSIDWCCLPHFDSPSLFAAILDVHKGGYFKISSAEKSVHKQMYFPETCILLTRFFTHEGVGEVIDFMTIEGKGESCEYHQIVRMVRVVRGTIKFRLECFPAFNYALDKHKVRLRKGGAVFETAKERAGLTSPVSLHSQDGGVICEFVMKQGQSKNFIFRRGEHHRDNKLIDIDYDANEAFERMTLFWRNWVSGIRYQGRWREMVYRSAMTLKLLTFQPTGAIIAAPTTSLPETLGGARNFDYRYTWIRDAAFTVYAFLRLGLTQEAEQFMKWIDERAHEKQKDGSLQIMYGIHGKHALDERILTHLEGYRKSSPVRIGNAASNQLQLDIYGELMDAVYLSNKYSNPISHDLWQHLRALLEYVCQNWKRKDEGIWEVRGGRHHFVFSKLMCWVALDRGIRLARKRSFPADLTKWQRVRDTIYEEIMTKGWNEKRQSFVQHYDTDALDASNLIMPMVFFISPTDPRMSSTIQATIKTLASDSLLHRYQFRHGADDGFEGKEGSFSMCSFWLVECLTRAGRLNEARFLFEKMHSYANHLGLYSEEIGPTGEFLGNFPQAFTHMSLISAAYNLNRKLGE